ncbi:hypothetical protein N8522_06255 [Akkermansiaceae bacterium]|nr:hypothetical protein [Akkermansiaceae bacterium]
MCPHLLTELPDLLGALEGAAEIIAPVSSISFGEEDEVFDELSERK